MKNYFLSPVSYCPYMYTSVQVLVTQPTFAQALAQDFGAGRADLEIRNISAADSNFSPLVVTFAENWMILQKRRRSWGSLFCCMNCSSSNLRRIESPLSLKQETRSSERYPVRATSPQPEPFVSIIDRNGTKEHHRSIFCKICEPSSLVRGQNMLLVSDRSWAWWRGHQWSLRGWMSCGVQEIVFLLFPQTQKAGNAQQRSPCLHLVGCDIVLNWTSWV